MGNDTETRPLSLLPAENMAYTVATAQAGRGDSVPPNTAAALLLTIERLDSACRDGATEADDFVNDLLENAPENWDGDEAAEAIAVAYVRHLEAEVARIGGCPNRGPFDAQGGPWPDPVARLADLRQLAADMLASFTDTNDAAWTWSARVGQVQIAKWRKVLDGEP